MQHNNSQSTDNFSSSCTQTRSHIHCTSFLLLPLPFFLCHTHINPPPPPNTSLAFPVSLTPSHSLPLIWNDCETTKTLWKYQIPHTIHVGGWGGGGWRLQKSYWQKAIGNETERMAEPSVQSRRNKTIAMCPDCRLIAMRILYYTSQPLINKYINMVFNVHRNHKAYRDGGKGVWTDVGEEPRRGR